MRILLASDCGPLSAAIESLFRDGGPTDGLIGICGLSDAQDRVVQHRPDAVIIGFSPEPERGLAALREILETLPCRVICVGGDSDAKLILRSLREGAWGYIDESDLATELEAALGKLRLETPLLVQHGRVVTVIGPAGGTGASTTAVNIATALAQKYGECCLIDLNLETGDLATLLDLEPAHTLADFCYNLPRMDATMFQQCLTPHASGIRLLAPPRDYSDVAAVTPRGMRKALAMARSAFPFVVIDLEHSAGELHAQALFQSDRILLVLRLDFTSLRQAGRILQHFDKLGIPRDRVRLIANRYRQPHELRVADLEQALGMKIDHFIPDDSKNVNLANNKGVPVIVERPRSRASQSLRELAWSVNGQSSATVQEHAPK
jgi:pilus assembly protein CpaE